MREQGSNPHPPHLEANAVNLWTNWKSDDLIYRDGRQKGLLIDLIVFQPERVRLHPDMISSVARRAATGSTDLNFFSALRAQMI